MMSKIQGVLFDCDGVLFDSETKVRKIMHEELQKTAKGYDLNFDEFLHAVRGLSNGPTQKVLESKGIEIPDGFFAKADKFLMENYENFADKTENVVEMLTALDEFPKAVCSNNWTKIYSKALHKHDMDKYFIAKLGVDIVERPKPDPCVYLEGAKRIGVPITNCLAIEDTPGIGIQAAKASKAAVVVGYTGSGTTVEEFEANGADYTIDSLLELPILIKKLNKEY
jgi:HAD superfamily hydrolase (TIGR01509 family)